MTRDPDHRTGFVPHVTEHRFDPETGKRQSRTRLLGDYSADAWSRWIHDETEEPPK